MVRRKQDVGCEDICSFEPEFEEYCDEDVEGEACELDVYDSKQDFFRATGVGMALLVSRWLMCNTKIFNWCLYQP